MRLVLNIFSSLRLTVTLLALSMVLIFVATLDQSQWGVYEVQRRYFEALIAFWHYPPQWAGARALGWLTVPLPGGFLLGGLLVVNLLCAHFRHFKPGWRKAGIALIHGGLLLLIISGFLTVYFQKESYMWVDVGGRSNFIESFRDLDLVLIDHTDPNEDLVISIPSAVLQESVHSGAPIKNPALPFAVKPLFYYPNTAFVLRSQNPQVPELPANRGVGGNKDLAVVEKPFNYTGDSQNLASAVIGIETSTGSAGQWLVSNFFDRQPPPFVAKSLPQTFTVDGHTWEIALRPRRDYLPFTIFLDKFIHEIYPGTDVPKRFESQVRLVNPVRNEDRPVLVYMNHPLRYEGLTIFQASFAESDSASMFQVVRNPGWLLPYFSVAIVGFGLALHFILSFSAHLRRDRARAALAAPSPVFTPARVNTGSGLAYVASLCLILLGAILLVFGFPTSRGDPHFDLAGFGRLPVQFGTRVLPLDSVARNSLRLFSGRTAINKDEKSYPPAGLHLPAIQWLLDVAFRPEVAARFPVFRVDHDEVLGLIGREQQGSQTVSFHDLEPFLQKIDSSANAAQEKAREHEPLSSFDREILRLRDNMVNFRRLTLSLVPSGSPQPVQDWQVWQETLKPGAEALEAEEANRPFDRRTLDAFMMQIQEFMQIQKLASTGIIPPQGDLATPWSNVGTGALQAIRSGQINPILLHYAQLGSALQKSDAAAFNTSVQLLQQDLAAPTLSLPVRFEALINQIEPFFRGTLLYLLAFFCACLSLVFWGPEMRRAALWLLLFGFMMHTFGLAARVYITGFGMVTNLYSASLFVGWVAVVFGLVMEFWKKNAIGAAAASFVGFGMLIIAHNLPFGGDDLELPRAVLASNFWLWTHVKCIVAGYGAMFLAGTLGAGYLLAGACSSRFNATHARELAQLVYGVTCFATLFSFVGTMLGGIWADQSWGRFWGWDPKENGALLIVLWCAIFLHCRWGRLVSERALMALAVGGNIVTAWSGLGVNLLGVGLHSYGFMDGGVLALVAFVLSQLAIMAVAFLPPRLWRSRLAVA